jgi:pilus assembly protein Flp/PilA
MLFAHHTRTAQGHASGQGLVEYALIIVLVAIVVIAALLILGPVVGNAFSTVNNSLTSI